MVNGENRAKMKALAHKLGGTSLGAALNVGNAIETLFQDVIINPTTRVVDFIDVSRHTVFDEAFKAKKKAARGGHFKVIFARPLSHHASFVAPNYPKNKIDTDAIDDALAHNFVFDHLAKSKRLDLIGAFEPIIVKTGTKIIEEGDTGDYFYVVGTGDVDFLIDGNKVGSVEKGGSFGELALLYDAPRAATCVARSQCGLFRLDQETFKRMLERQIQKSHQEVVDVLKSVPYFQDLDGKYLDMISSNLRVVNFNDGDVMVSQDSPKRFYIIKEGRVDVMHIQSGGSTFNDAKGMGPGFFFGEMAVTQGKYSMGSVIARGHVVAMVLEREDFIKVVGNDMGSLIKKTVDKKKLQIIPFGKRKNPVEDNELGLLAAAIKDTTFKKGHVFFTEGKHCLPALYLIREGSVSIHTSKNLNLAWLLGFNVSKADAKIIEKNGYFGNDTMGDNESGEFGIAQYTVTALEDVVVGVLDMIAIKKVIAAKSEVKVTMDDLTMVRILGAGTFGKVWLVSNKKTKDSYALKVQNKKDIIDYNQVDGVIREKDIMAKVDHPFLIKMISHWKDENKLYMLMKMYQGGELQTVIHTDSRDGVPEWAAKFYAANILEGLSYMHHRSIVYRDLKPANVMLDSAGYTVIVDFGFAKIITDNKTYTFCGTPLYLAPEIILQKGHNAGADHWSWGVMLFEMIVGMTPFYDGTQDQMKLFKNIAKCRMVSLPDEDIMSTFAMDLIKRMLTVNQADRLGSFHGADKDIRSHPFFDDINWDDLLAKKVEVPFKPKISDPLDGSNFDDYSKLEAKVKKEQLLILTGAEQKLFNAF